MDSGAFIKIFEFAKDNNLTVEIKYHNHDNSYFLMFTDSDYLNIATYISADILNQVLDKYVYLNYIINNLLKELKEKSDEILHQ